MTDLAQAMLEHFESCKLKSYLDTKGVPTIGWGHTGPEVFYPGMTCTQEQADAWLQADMAEARLEASSFPHYAIMSPVRQAVCVSMCYQMGRKPLYWPEFTAALEVADFAGAAADGLDSKWAEFDSPARARSEMKMLGTGRWDVSIPTGDST